MIRNPLRRASLALLLATLLSPCGAAQAADAANTYVFGIVPQQSGSKLARLWTPVLEYLEQQTGYHLRFATARNIPTFEKRLAQGKYDIAYMNPYHYVRFHEQTGYEAFAKAKDKRLKGILVVRKDSPFRTLEDLDDRELAFPAHAFAASQVTRAEFEQEGIPITVRYVASHDSVYRNVASGHYPAGGGVLRTFRNTAPEFRDQLRVLWTSRDFTPHAFAAHPRVPRQVVERIQRAMLAMDRSPEGRALLASLRLKGIEGGQDAEWNDVRALQIE